MIHRSSRDSLALALRRYAARRIANDDLDAVEVDWRDRGAVAVKEAAWCLYDDNYQHKAEGRNAIDRETRREIARWVVFLHSDQASLWPEYKRAGLVDGPMNILTFGWWERHKNQRWLQYQAAGDIAVWPFGRRAAADDAIRRPKHLRRVDAQPLHRADVLPAAPSGDRAC